MIITYKGWNHDSPAGERIDEQTYTKEVFYRDALSTLESVKMYVNLELVSVEPSARECIRCYTDLSASDGYQIIVEREAMPETVTLCEYCNRTHNYMTKAQYDNFVSVYTITPLIERSEAE